MTILQKLQIKVTESRCCLCLFNGQQWTKRNDERLISEKAIMSDLM